VLAAAAIAWGIGDARAALESRRRRFASRPADVHYGLPSPALKLVALRYREALADLLWVRALLYFGISHELDRAPRHIDLHMEAVLALDPHFERAYRTAAGLSRYRPVPKRAALERAIEFLVRGAERFPEQWRFPFFIGAHYLEMPARSPAERTRLRLMAADWVQRAALLGAGRGAPDWLANLAATVRTEEGQREIALRYLEEMLLTAPDEATRAQVRAKILQLRGRVEADRVSREAERFLHAWRTSYPYVPGDLFVLLGRRPDREPVELRAMVERSLPPEAE
jgi:hypothetical protein